MAKFDKKLALKIGKSFISDSTSEFGLANSFAAVCEFLSENPERLSWRSKTNQPSVYTEDGIKLLASKYFEGYRKSDFPVEPGTVPDEMVSIVMQITYGYTEDQAKKIKIEHQHSMSAENCVGALLERYIDSVLRRHNWHWCCGSFVKAVDFISLDKNSGWHALQVKNRDNTENSSSSAIRNGTPIQKWFRSFSKSGGTNWDDLPDLMKGYKLSEKGFIEFVKLYLNTEKKRITIPN